MTENQAHERYRRSRPLILTPAIARLLKQIRDWAQSPIVGVAISGNPRVGKTEAMRYVGMALKKDGDYMPFYEIPGRKFSDGGGQEKVFWQHVLDSLGHAFAVRKGDNEVTLKRRLINFYAEECDRSSDDKVVLWIDAANEFLPHQWGWLSNFFDQLSLEGVNVLILAVGYCLDAKRFDLFNNNLQTYIGRFMADDHQLWGIRTKKELALTLRSYDTYDSGDPDTGPLLPLAFPAFYEDSRLEVLASRIFTQFEAEWQTIDFDEKLEIPMQHLSDAIRRILDVGKTVKIRDEHIISAVQATRLPAFISKVRNLRIKP